MAVVDPHDDHDCTFLCSLLLLIPFSSIRSVLLLKKNGRERETHGRQESCRPADDDPAPSPAPSAS